MTLNGAYFISKTLILHRYINNILRMRFKLITTSLKIDFEISDKKIDLKNCYHTSVKKFQIFKFTFENLIIIIAINNFR